MGDDFLRVVAITAAPGLLLILLGNALVVATFVRQRKTSLVGGRLAAAGFAAFTFGLGVAVAVWDVSRGSWIGIVAGVIVFGPPTIVMAMLARRLRAPSEASDIR